MIPADPFPCPIRDRLASALRAILVKTIQLEQQLADTLKSNGTARQAEIDLQIDILIGEKERALGALNQHREEHGC